MDRENKEKKKQSETKETIMYAAATQSRNKNKI